MKLARFYLIIAALLLFSASAAFASFSYSVTVNTANLAGTLGSFDFQFNPATGPLCANAVIANFSGGTLIGDPETFGAVEGLLPANVTITASSPFNDYFQQFIYGDAITFELGLAGIPGSSFFFSMFSDSAGTIPALTLDPNGFSLIVDINKNETGTITTSSPQTTVTAVPIPTALWLMGLGLLGLISIRRRES